MLKRLDIPWAVQSNKEDCLYVVQEDDRAAAKQLGRDADSVANRLTP